MKYSENTLDDNFVYASIDVNGLKVVNDDIGHAAGDELLKGAADCMKKAFDKYGKVYRTGGDEFVCILFAGEKQLKDIEAELDRITANWTGELVSSLSLSVGYVTKREFKEDNILEMAKIADKKMYKAKSAYYARKGVDRRGQAAAHTALHNLYTKILKVNITDDTMSEWKEIRIADGKSGWIKKTMIEVI